MLANASLDVAFHDRIDLYLSCIINCKSNDKEFNEKIIDMKSQYFTIYWMGLMDAIGSIQVNYNKRFDKLEYNFCFKLPRNLSSWNIIWHFNVFSYGILKNENYNKKNKHYIFRINCDEKKFSNILDKTFRDHGFPLTSKLNYQLSFAESCIENGKMWYFDNRKNKYSQQNSKIKNLSEQRLRITKENYFPTWLSGFLHAKSSCKKSNNRLIFFLDGLDNYIAEEIQYFFGMTNKPQKNKRGNYFIRIHNQKIISKIKNHFLMYTTLNIDLLSKLTEIDIDE